MSSKRVRFRCYWCNEDKYAVPVLIGRDVMSGLVRQLFSCKECDDAEDTMGGEYFEKDRDDYKEYKKIFRKIRQPCLE